MITDKEISLALADFSGRFGGPRIGGIEESESMQRIVRCWFDQVEQYCYQHLGEGVLHRHPHHDLMVRIVDGFESDKMYRGWFNNFALPVITDKMREIKHYAALVRDAGLSGHAFEDHISEQLNASLESFDPRTVEAFHKLREVEILLGLPPNYYMQRRRDDMGDSDESIKTMRRWRSAGNRGFFQTTRAPCLEPYRNYQAEPEEYYASRKDLAAVAFLHDGYRRTTEHLAKRGGKSFEHWAIRSLWKGISNAYENMKRTPDIGPKPWATIRDVLALCDVAVDSEMVRKTLNKS